MRESGQGGGLGVGRMREDKMQVHGVYVHSFL